MTKGDTPLGMHLPSADRSKALLQVIAGEKRAQGLTSKLQRLCNAKRSPSMPCTWNTLAARVTDDTGHPVDLTLPKADFHILEKYIIMFILH